LQWLFIIEGLPSVVLGAVMLLLLPSGPLTAWMLTPKERLFLHNKVRSSYSWKLLLTYPSYEAFQLHCLCIVHCRIA
jgi:hypothetical protein